MKGVMFHYKHSIMLNSGKFFIGFYDSFHSLGWVKSGLREPPEGLEYCKVETY